MFRADAAKRFNDFAAWELASPLHGKASVERRRRPVSTIPDYAARCILDAGLTGYALLGELARGGMSTIYLGEDRATGERVAIKALNPFHVDHSDLVRRLLGEHELARRARHPGLVEIRCADQTASGVPYLVMEYLAGESLRALSDRVRLPREAALAFAAQVARALAALHAGAVVHCDLKPENVFVLDEIGSDGWPRIKVLDYGVARALDEAPASDGAIAGTPGFMPPEQWRGAPAPASDVYALGCVLYELLTRKPVFLGSLPQLMTAHTEQLPVRPAAIRPDIGPELDRLIVRMLAKDPDLRPSMPEVGQELSRMIPDNACEADLQATG